MTSGAAHDLEQPYINRALEPRSQLRWLYYLSLGTLWFLRGPAFSRVFVTNRGLTVDGPTGSMDIPFHQVKGLALVYVPYFGGWFTLEMQDGKRHRFSSFLERTDYVLDALAIAQPTIVPALQLANYRRSAIVADHTLARMEKAFADWHSLAWMQVALPLILTMVVSAILSVNELANVFLIFASLGLLNGLVTVVVWGCRELIQMLAKDAELVANPLNPLRDLRRENVTRIYSRLVHAVLVSILTWWMWV